MMKLFHHLLICYWDYFIKEFEILEFFYIGNCHIGNILKFGTLFNQPLGNNYQI